MLENPYTEGGNGEFTYENQKEKPGVFPLKSCSLVYLQLSSDSLALSASSLNVSKVNLAFVPAGTCVVVSFV